MIYLARHGQTDWNLFKRFNGHTDAYLNQTGIKQAKRLAEDLIQHKIDMCFCSPQTRARTFCEIIFKGSIIYDNRLAEIDCGEFEGTEETVEAMELFWQAIQIGDRGTESINAFINRNCSLCDEIMAKHKDKSVLIVTHAANVRIINYYFKGKPDNYNFKNRLIEQAEMITFDTI